MSTTIDMNDDECGCGQDCMACPVTPARSAWWGEAVRQMDHMRAMHAARDAEAQRWVDAVPPSRRLAPLIPHDYSLATALFGAETARTLERVDNGCNLYDALYPDGDPEWDEWEAECAARAAHREANAEHYRAEEAKAQLAYEQRRIEEKVADESKMRLNREQLKSGLKMEKKQCPCARLYSCVGDKKSGGAKPTTLHVSSECWSHERICPQTGALLTPHKCPWLHPGEAGWRTEWNANRLFKVAAPPPPAPHRLAAALGASGSAPQQQSRFAAMGAPVVATRAPWAAASAPRAPWADKAGGRPMSQSGGGNDGWERQKPKRR